MTEFDPSNTGPAQPADPPAAPTPDTPAQVIFEEPTAISAETDPAADLNGIILASTEPQQLFTHDTASSLASDLTARFPTLTPSAVGPTESNANHAVRIVDQADGWFAEISVDDEQHHTWLQEQIEAHLKT